MLVVRESVTDVLGPHDKDRRAVGKAPLFIVTLAIEPRGISELSAKTVFIPRILALRRDSGQD